MNEHKRGLDCRCAVCGVTDAFLADNPGFPCTVTDKSVQLFDGAVTVSVEGDGVTVSGVVLDSVEAQEARGDNTIIDPAGVDLGPFARVFIDGVEVARFKGPPKLIPHAELEAMGVVDAIKESMDAAARQRTPLTREQDTFKRLAREGLGITVKQLAPFTRIPLASSDLDDPATLPHRINLVTGEPVMGPFEERTLAVKEPQRSALVECNEGEGDLIQEMRDVERELFEDGILGDLRKALEAGMTDEERNAPPTPGFALDVKGEHAVKADLVHTIDGVRRGVLHVDSVAGEERYDPFAGPTEECTDDGQQQAEQQDHGEDRPAEEAGEPDGRRDPAAPDDGDT